MSGDGGVGDKTRNAMDSTAARQDRKPGERNDQPSLDPPLRVVPKGGSSEIEVPSGIERVDERLGGLEKGGTYLFVGPPGPAKLVAVLQFVHAGVQRGERALLLTHADAEGLLQVAEAWGSPLRDAWHTGTLEIVGFREDFELRVLRSSEPEAVLGELASLAGPDLDRIAVEPGSMFLQGGARSLLGRTFLDWARHHPATFCATLAVDRGEELPSSAEWLVQAVTGIFQVDRRPDGLLQLRLNRALPAGPGEDDPITLELRPGKGLVAPERFPARRRSDRPAGDPNRLLVISLIEDPAAELESWARRSFSAEIVAEPLDAVARLQAGAPVGGVLVHVPRTRIRDAVRACRALRPLTRGAIVVASDDAIRSTDRVSLLEAGADDCLTGGVDFRELGARIRRAVALGGKPPATGPAPTEKPAPQGGPVSRDTFAEEVARRAEDPALSVFSVVRLDVAGGAPPSLQRVLVEEIRDEEGDLVVCGPAGCYVLLQGTRRDPAHAFVARIRSALSRENAAAAAELDFEVMALPGDEERVRESLVSLSRRESGPQDLGPGETSQEPERTGPESSTTAAPPRTDTEG